MNTARILFIISIIQLWFFIPLKGQIDEEQLFIQGIPRIENFYEYDYGAEAANYDLTYSDNNYLYVLNPRGILEFDGIQWRIVHRYNASTKDRIYSYGNKIFYIKSEKIGFIYPEPTGEFKDSVLITGGKLNNAYSNHKIHYANNEIYFVTKDTLYVYAFGKGLSMIGAKNSFCASVLVGNRLIVNDYPYGLIVIHNQEMLPYYTNDILKKYRVFDITAIDTNHLLLSIMYKGIYEIKDARFSTFNELNEYYGGGLYTGERNLLYSTLMDGIVRFDNAKQINGLLNYSVGLADNNVVDMCYDIDSNVWVCTQNGISHVALAEPITSYNKSVGLLAQIENIVSHKGETYVCSRNGLYRIRLSHDFNTSLNQDSYQLTDEVEGIDAICYQVYSYHNYLLLSTSSGVYVVEGLQAIPLRNYSFFTKSTSSEFLYIKTISGHALYKYENNCIVRTQPKEWLFKNLIFGKDKIWFSDSTMLTQVDIRNNEFHESSIQLPDAVKSFKFNYIFTDSTNVYCALPGIVYKYIDRNNSWILDSSFHSILDTNKMIVKCYHAQQDSSILISVADLNDYSNYTTALYKKKDDSFSLEINLSAYVGNVRINSVYKQSEKLWWIGTKDELIAFNPRLATQSGRDRKVSIRNIKYSPDNRIIWLGYQFDDNEEFQYSKSELSFQFITNSFINRNNVRYSYYLEGYQDKWSDFSSTNKVNYTSLREGSYELKVRARFNDGYISDEFNYNFKVNPPWYRTYLAYSVYIGLILFIAYLIFKWRLYYIQQDRKHLEEKVNRRTEQLNKSNAELVVKTHELEEMDKVKSNFFANISHELRTPLTLILGPLTNLINNEKSSEKLKEFKVMKRNSLQLKQHIEQFLELSKIESGNLILHKEAVNIDGFIKRVLASFESLAELRSIELSYSGSNADIHANIDKKNMEIVLNNLLSNALKFTPENGGVAVSTQNDRTHVRISVKDTGIGIAEKNLPYIFKRFYQADTSISKQYEGTGIGLALTKEIVELHGGEISVSSKIDQGSEFVILLPLCADGVSRDIDQQTNDAADSLVPEMYYTSDEENGGKERPVVLVVEDNLDMQNYLKDLLKDRFEVHLAGNGKEGLELAKSLNPHLIVSDVMMPVKDGFTMVDDIRNIPEISHIPIIMLTARADEESKLMGLRKGVEEYLSKPFSKDELLIRISNIVKRRAAVKEKVTKKLVLEPQELELTSLDEQFLIKAGEIIEENITNSGFDIQLLSDLLNMSRRHLHRKVKLLTDMSPSEFVRSYKLKKAAQMLQQKADSVSQIAYSVGFDDLSYFTKCFKTQFGKTPKEFGA